MAMARPPLLAAYHTLEQRDEVSRLVWEMRSIKNILRVDKAHVVMLAEQGRAAEAGTGASLPNTEELVQPGGIQLEQGYCSMVLQFERTWAGHG